MCESGASRRGRPRGPVVALANPRAPPPPASPRAQRPLRGLRNGPLLGSACEGCGAAPPPGEHHAPRSERIEPVGRSAEPARARVGRARATRAGHSPVASEATRRRRWRSPPARRRGGGRGGPLQYGGHPSRRRVGPRYDGYGTMATVRWPRYDGHGTMATVRWPRYDGYGTGATVRWLRYDGYGTMA